MVMMNRVMPVLMGLARHVLTLAAGWLVAKGYLSDDAAGQLVGAVVALVGVAWSAHDKVAPLPTAAGADKPVNTFPK